jgi:hypothetical protein
MTELISREIRTRKICKIFEELYLIKDNRN